MINMLLLSVINYFCALFFKTNKTAYLFMASLMIAIMYILEPLIIFMLPIYVTIFAFVSEEKNLYHRLAQSFTFAFPPLAAIFFLSYTSWIYDRGFKLSLINNDFINQAVYYSGYRNSLYFFVNLLSGLSYYVFSYILFGLWVIISKKYTTPFIYIYLTPIFFHFTKYYLLDFKLDYRAYLLYFTITILFFNLFHSEMEKRIKFVLGMILFINLIWLVLNF